MAFSLDTQSFKDFTALIVVQYGQARLQRQGKGGELRALDGDMQD